MSLWVNEEFSAPLVCRRTANVARDNIALLLRSELVKKGMMKEQVYAWYPPASDILKSYRETELDSYTKECLYRYASSRFHESRFGGSRATEESAGKVGRDEPSAKRLDEIAPKTFLRVPQPPPGPYPPSVRSKSAVEGKLQGRRSPEPGSRLLERVGSSFQAHRGRASSAWIKSKEWLAETSTSCGGVAADEAVLNPSASRLTTGGHATRVQSAVIRRQRSQLVKRSVQSAGPERLSATLADPAAVEVGTGEESAVCRRLRPRGPTPRQWREEEETCGKEETVDGMKVDFPLDYDEQLKIHGWKMEVPGDPLRMKRSCIAKRLSTCVVIPVEEVTRKPFPSRVQSSETFFYNTIPRMPMSFTISPDWASEILQTKRLDLKAKTGRNGHRIADFSFVY